MIVFLLFLSLFSTSWAEEEEPMAVMINEVDMSPPEDFKSQFAANKKNVVVAYMVMPVDHFDQQPNPTTFAMRYMYNKEFFGGDGYPIFIMVGGEWNIEEGWLLSSNMYEMARENKGFQVYTELRYYGESQIFSNFTTENLRFLNVDQALADLAYFIKKLKKQPQFVDSEVIMYGGSYAANLVMWFKQKYPDLVLGTIASSGPFLAKVDFPEYLEVVHEALSLDGGKDCIDLIKQGIDDTVAALKTPKGRRQIKNTYRLCRRVDYKNKNALAVFSGLITWAFSASVQHSTPGTLMRLCQNFTDQTYGVTPMEKIAGYISRNMKKFGCWDVAYDNFIKRYKNATNSRAWFYQTCTEYGFFQTAPKSGTVFDGLEWLNLDFYMDACQKIFGKKFDLAFAEEGVKKINSQFGGLKPVVNNTINIHGYFDPWRELGVYKENISETSPTFTVPRASHCFDMGAWAPTNTMEMSAIQVKARSIVTSWLSKPKP